LVKAAPQWVELHNRDTSLPVALTGISIEAGTGSETIRQPSYLAPGAFVRYLLGEPGFSQALDLSLPESGTIAIYAPSGALLNQLVYATSTPEVSQGRLPDGTGALTAFPGSPTPAAPNAVVSYAGPTINEVMANNHGAVVDSAGDWPDWIELHNAGGADFDMSGMTLRVNSRLSSAWTFPAGSIVPAGGYLRLWCDDRSPLSTANIGQALADEGGGVWLYNTAGQQVDAVVYGHQAVNLSIGKTAGVWRLLATPTPSAANSAAATLGNTNELRINEWMPAPGEGNDWVELHNPGALPVEMSGMYLTDTPSLAGRTNTQIIALSFIAAKGYAVFEASGDAATGAGHASFRLSDEGESIRLYTSALTLVDGVDFGTTPADVSRGRYPNGEGGQQSFSGTASRGAENYLDSDGDGLPDAWESANGSNLLVADASSDSDGDGANNGAEFLANTDPQDGASVLRAEVLSQELGFVIRFRAEESRSYVVQVKSTLEDAAWQKLRAVPAGAAREVEITDPAATGERRFYRVVTPAVP
ncbi:MAG: lamin tail domain-containing protein, partial [Chthoniobacteraceae bacterium]